MIRLCLLALLLPIAAKAEISDLDRHFSRSKVHIRGERFSCGTRQHKFFQTLFIYYRDIQTVAEIGFGAGHSSEYFLQAKCEVVSFDLMKHPFARKGKQYIDQTYPGRHTLIEGDSKETVPTFVANNPNIVFDLIFIDGGQSFEAVLSDLCNMRNLADENTFLVLNNTHKKEVSRAWAKALDDQIVQEVELVYEGKKSWILGRFLCKPLAVE